MTDVQLKVLATEWGIRWSFKITCIDLIQIIFRELVYSLLKSLILKFVKNVKS